MSIVENRKAFHDYFVEERYEAGLVLEGWEVKAIRAGRAQIGDAYVIVAGRRAVADRRAYQPAALGLDPRHGRSDAHPQAAAASPRKSGA